MWGEWGSVVLSGLKPLPQLLCESFSEGHSPELSTATSLWAAPEGGQRAGTTQGKHIHTQHGSQHLVQPRCP